MRIALLTTDTDHHAWFAHRLAERHGVVGALVETRPVVASFPTHHPFEDRRADHERETLRPPGGIAAVCPVVEVASVNDPDAIAALIALRPDIAIVYGTGILRESVIAVPALACLNLHGGDPERYRGLDSHLWSLYHDDPAGLVACLHHVDVGIDTGDIVATTAIGVGPGTGAHELRALTARACVGLAALAVEAAQEDGRVPGRPQSRRGRYYSFMPAELKERAVRSLARHVATLS